MPKTRKTRSRRNLKNKNPLVFRKLSNVAFNGLERGVNGVGRLGKGAVRITGRVVGVGTGAANTVLGTVGRLGRRITKRARNSLRKK